MPAAYFAFFALLTYCFEKFPREGRLCGREEAQRIMGQFYHLATISSSISCYTHAHIRLKILHTIISIL